MTQLDKNKKYTLGEFIQYVKEEERAELHEGTPVFMAPASFQHENIIMNLGREFGNALKGKSCYIFGSNLQVIFPFENKNKGKNDVVVLPDISIVCDKNKLHNNSCYGAPDLIVEVLSPSTSRNDRLLKKNYYEKAGVKEYLIVGHKYRSIEKYVLNDGAFVLENIYDQENKVFYSSIFPDISFSTDEIFSFLD
ncbi:Uma2 family endonuclease [Virgibacillus doumboii]|uniref:Uma2 family endonuclease n=1 Tax=Virgibacillus doumboii TaxID=2697503 RepID=UPI0013DF7D14|nr:Uma2 family endonuclease [Virgibacillus doumboii]